MNHLRSHRVTVVELLEKSDNLVKVRGLHAINGTPILDTSSSSSPEVPGHKLWEEWKSEKRLNY
ncbi:MAG: hypothetical protein M3P08_12230 [Thermoproteota archaeon]|nr:hypothetical protein [Thermoproteota archaeon]